MLVADMDDVLACDPSVSSAAAYLLESAASSAQFREMSTEDFWRAFDTVVPGVAQDDTNSRRPDDHDWVAVAINTSMGNLALAFLNALFARRLVMGGGVPADLTERFVRLIGAGEARHRPARVVFASRLSYLFAIDPDLTRLHLLPYFRWERDETEALAVWQGFGWQPHLDPLLWNEIKADFLACFQEDRINQLGETVGPLAQALTAAGHGAKAFADMKKRPPIEWFDEFERREVDILAAHKKAVEAAQVEGDDLPPYPQLVIEPLFPWAHDARLAQLPPQSVHLARWLAQHIDDYGLATRVIQKLANQRFLHPFLMGRIRQYLREGGDLKPGLAKLWKLITSTSDDTLALGRLFPFELKVPETLDSGDDALAFKVDLLSALRPSVSLAQPFDTRLPDFNPNAEGEEEQAGGLRLSEVVNAKVVIPGDAQVGLLVERILARGESAAFLASLLPELTTLLRRTVDLFTLTDQASAGTDISVFHRPSIVPHAQNRGYEKWTLIITLIWHGWQHLDQIDPVASRRIVGEWLASEAIVLRRIGLAALNHAQGFNWHQKMEHLLDG